MSAELPLQPAEQPHSFDPAFVEFMDDLDVRMNEGVANYEQLDRDVDFAVLRGLVEIVREPSGTVAEAEDALQKASTHIAFENVLEAMNEIGSTLPSLLEPTIAEREASAANALRRYRDAATQERTSRMVQGPTGRLSDRLHSLEGPRISERRRRRALDDLIRRHGDQNPDAAPDTPKN